MNRMNVRGKAKDPRVYDERYVADMAKSYARYEAIASNVPLPDARFNEIMQDIKTLITPDELKIFKKDMETIREGKIADNQELTNAYYKDRLNSNFVLLVFTFILPQLIKEYIPNAIAGKVVFALNLYTIHLARLFYQIFIDKNTPMHKRLNEGKLLSLDIFKELSTPDTAPTSASASTTASLSTTQGYNLQSGLHKIKKYVESFMNKNKYFDKDPRHRLRFKLFYLSIFIVLLYITTRFDIDELTPNPQIEQLSNGGKKKSKPKKKV